MDLERLSYLVAKTKYAKRCDRYRIALLALQGFTAVRIADKIGCARRTARDWGYRYRDEGIDVLCKRPRTGASVALLSPTVNTIMMNHHLQMISTQIGPGVQVVLVLDQAGWHVSKALEIPDNITLLPLPPILRNSIRSNACGLG